MDKSVWYVRASSPESLWNRYRNRKSGGMMGYTTETSQSQNVESDKKYTESDLQSLTNNQIKQIASDRGYSLSATNKAGLISEFLMWQG